MWVPAIFQIEDPAAHMTWNSWHMGGIERKARICPLKITLTILPCATPELPRCRESPDPEHCGVCGCPHG